MSAGTELVASDPKSTELAVTTQQAMARHEIEGAIVVAQKFPRNEQEAFGQVMLSCKRFKFASMAEYSFPRGRATIRGGSVDLAREVARCWGNIRYGADIVHDDDETRTVRGWAWDVQTNAKETQDATFRKLIYRKKDGGKWIKPDERDLRELTNKHGAICVRNCIFHLVPPDLVEDAIETSRATVEKGIREDVDSHRKKLIVAFGGLGVTVEDLELFLGNSVSQATTAQIGELRTIWKSISDGNSLWKEYVADKQPEKQPENGGATIDDLTKSPTGDPRPTEATAAAKNLGEQTPAPDPPPEVPDALEKYAIDIHGAKSKTKVQGIHKELTEGRYGEEAQSRECLNAAADLRDWKLRQLAGLKQGTLI